MDDDDTLTMMPCPDQNNIITCQYLGGPAWYTWQNSLLNKNSKYRVAANSKELLEISFLLLSMNYMSYTEKDIPQTLRSLTKSGSHLLVETARGVENLSATANQFSNLTVTGPNPEILLEFISKNSLTGTKSGTSSIASPFNTCSRLKRPIAYQQGIMYLAGQDKGVALKCFLDKTNSSFIKYIVFIDDTLENVENVIKEFKNQTKITVKAFHYTALEAHKLALTKGKDKDIFQNNTKKKWDAIRKVLKGELQQPAIP